MKKRIREIGSVALAAILLLAGCGSGASEANQTGSNQAASAGDAQMQDKGEGNQKIGGKLVIWEHASSFEDALKSVIEGFQEKYPDVDVEYSVKTSDQYYNLLQTAMQANECPDLFWTNGQATTNFQAYVDQGLMMDLTDKVDFSLYDGTNAMKIVTAKDGKIYSTPTAETGGRAVFYNKRLFKEKGYQIPKKLSEFEALLAEMAKTDEVPISLGATDPWDLLFIFEPVLAATHLDWIQEYEKIGYAPVNDSRVVDAYKKMAEWGDKGYFGRNWTGISGEGASLAFSTEKALMYIGGTWNISTFKENNPKLDFGAFQIPCEDGQIPFVSTSSCGLGVSSKTENKEAALAFANYFASKEGQSRWLEALGAISCVPSIQSKEAVVNDIQNGYTVQATSYYDILGKEAGKGDSPCNLWEEDQCKIFTGGLSIQKFVDSLQSLCLTKEEMSAGKS